MLQEIQYKMARFVNKPKNRAEFKDYIRRRLGAPILDIEVTDFQMDDIVDDTIEMFNNFHQEGAFRTYRRVLITRELIENNKVMPNLNLPNDASAVDPMYNPVDGSYEGEVGMDASNTTYLDASGATHPDYIETMGGVPIPEDIIGVTRVFRLPGSSASHWMSGQYQAMLQIFDNFALSSRMGGGQSAGGGLLTTFETQMRYIEELTFSLNQVPAIRFSKLRNRLFLDSNWEKFNEGDWMGLECRQALDPEIYPDVWQDRWVRDYAAACAKIQWGTNLLKYNGVNLIGGVTLNGATILAEGKEEKTAALADLNSKYFPTTDQIYIG